MLAILVDDHAILHLALQTAPCTSACCGGWWVAVVPWSPSWWFALSPVAVKGAESDVPKTFAVLPSCARWETWSAPQWRRNQPPHKAVGWRSPPRVQASSPVVPPDPANGGSTGTKAKSKRDQRSLGQGAISCWCCIPRALCKIWKQQKFPEPHGTRHNCIPTAHLISPSQTLTAKLHATHHGHVQTERHIAMRRHHIFHRLFRWNHRLHTQRSGAREMCLKVAWVLPCK